MNNNTNEITDNIHNRRGPNPNCIIGVRAPCGHDLFPNGVHVDFLDKHYRIRFTDFQQVILSKTERSWFSKTAERDGDYPIHYEHGCYQLRPDQYAWIRSSIVCAVCATARSTENPPHRIVCNKLLF